MYKSTLLPLLLFTSLQAHAGWFDFLSGSDKETQGSQSTEQSSAPPEVEQASGIAQTLSDATPLLSSLSKQLGVSDTQASGGMGALLQVAQSTLSSSDFSTLSQSIPDMDTLLKAAPAVMEEQGMMGGLLKKASEYNESAKLVSQVTSQFDALGLDMSMIPKFIEVVQNYFSDSNNQATTDLFTKGMEALL